MIPSVISVSKTGKEGLDLLSYDFTKNRKIYLFSEITDEIAMEIIAQLEYLDRNGTEGIKIYINSPGGSVSAGFAIAVLADNAVAVMCQRFAPAWLRVWEPLFFPTAQKAKGMLLP